MFRNRYFALAILFTSATTAIKAEDVFIEAKAAYYFPSNNKFRSIYGGNGIYGGEISFQSYKNLYTWGSANCFYRTGNSKGGHVGTNITFVPVGIGLKYLFPIDYVDLYLGAGMLATYAHVRNHARFVSPTLSQWGAGAILKAGALFNVNQSFFIDLFSDYSFIKITFPPGRKRVTEHKATLSGWSVGLGFGYRFGRPTKKKPSSAQHKPVEQEEVSNTTESD